MRDVAASAFYSSRGADDHRASFEHQWIDRVVAGKPGMRASTMGWASRTSNVAREDAGMFRETEKFPRKRVTFKRVKTYYRDFVPKVQRTRQGSEVHRLRRQGRVGRSAGERIGLGRIGDCRGRRGETAAKSLPTRCRTRDNAYPTTVFIKWDGRVARMRYGDRQPRAMSRRGRQTRAALSLMQLGNRMKRRTSC